LRAYKRYYLMIRWNYVDRH